MNLRKVETVHLAIECSDIEARILRWALLHYTAESLQRPELAQYTDAAQKLTECITSVIGSQLGF